MAQVKTITSIWILTAITILAGSVFGIHQLATYTTSDLIIKAANARANQHSEQAFEYTDQAELLTIIARQLKADVAIATAQNYESIDAFHDAAKQYQKASELIAQNITSHPLNTDDAYNHTLINAASSYFKSGNNESAIDFYSKAAPDYLSKKNYLELGRSHLNLSNKTSAISTFQNGLKASPKDPDLSYYLAISLLEEDVNQAATTLKEVELTGIRQDHAQKIIAAAEVLSESSSTIFRHITLAKMFNRIGEPQLAQNHANLALKEDQNYRDAWVLLAESQFLLKLYPKALDSVTVAIEKDPTYKYSLELKAKIHTTQGNLTAAKEAQSQADKL